MKSIEHSNGVIYSQITQEKYIYDSSSMVDIIDENHVLFKTLTGSFQLSGNGIAIALRDIITSFQTAVFPEHAIEYLKSKYEKGALRKLISFLKLKRVLIPEAYFADISSFDKNFLEKYRYYSLGGKSLTELDKELGDITIGLVCNYQFADCFFRNFGKASLIRHFNCIITDRAMCSINDLTSKSEIVFFNNDSEAQINSLIRKSDFIIVSSNHENYSLFRFVNEKCLEAQKKWIRVVINSERSEIGPLFVPGETSCYSCLTRRAINNMSEKSFAFYNLFQERSKEFCENELATYSSHYMTLLTADLMSHEIMRFFAGFECNLLGSILTFFKDGYRIEKAEVFKYSQCDSCGDRG